MISCNESSYSARRNFHAGLVAAAAFAFAIAMAAPAQAQRIDKTEPPLGGMRGGEVIFVDNGKCPKGQIMKVTAGMQAGKGAAARGVAKRERECVPRPK